MRWFPDDPDGGPLFGAENLQRPHGQDNRSSHCGGEEKVQREQNAPVHRDEAHAHTVVSFSRMNTSTTTNRTSTRLTQSRPVAARKDIAAPARPIVVGSSRGMAEGHQDRLVVSRSPPSGAGRGVPDLVAGVGGGRR